MIVKTWCIWCWRVSNPRQKSPALNPNVGIAGRIRNWRGFPQPRFWVCPRKWEQGDELCCDFKRKTCGNLFVSQSPFTLMSTDSAWVHLMISLFCSLGSLRLHLWKHGCIKGLSSYATATPPTTAAVTHQRDKYGNRYDDKICIRIWSTKRWNIKYVIWYM